MSDARYIGTVNLTLSGGSARVIGSVDLTLDYSVLPVLAFADMTLNGVLDATPSFVRVVVDATRQGDSFLSFRVTSTAADGAAQGDTFSLGPRAVAFADSTRQGDDVVAIAYKATTALADGTTQGDAHRVLAAVSVSDGADQGDAYTLARSILAANGALQGDSLDAAALSVVTAFDGTLGGDTWSLSGLQVLVFGDGTAQGDEVRENREMFCINADTGAVSRYLFGRPVSGFAMTDSVFMLATDTGLYALDGADDEGSDITWSLDTEFSLFKSPYFKRLSYISVLSRSTNQIDLRLVSASNGIKRSDRYRMPAVTRATYRDGRIKVGKGIKSIYYGIGLSGHGPAEIDSLHIEIEELSRRR